jgi:hypothetical protein
MDSPFFRNNEGGVKKKNPGREEWTGWVIFEQPNHCHCRTITLPNHEARGVCAFPFLVYGNTSATSFACQRFATTALRSHHLPSNVRCENDPWSDSTITAKLSFMVTLFGPSRLLDVRSYTLITKPLPLLCVGLASSMEGQNQKRDYQIGKPQQGLTSVWTNTTFVVLLGNRSTARVSHIDSYGTPQPEQKYIFTPTHWHLSGAWHENSVRCAPEMCSSGPCCRSCFGAM